MRGRFIQQCNGGVVKMYALRVVTDRKKDAVIFAFPVRDSRW